MDRRIEILKGLHPGLFIQRELSSRKLKSGAFAESLGEHPQTLSAIIRGRRSMNTSLSLRIEHALGLEEGFLMTLQIFYDIAEEKRHLAEQYRPGNMGTLCEVYPEACENLMCHTLHR